MMLGFGGALRRKTHVIVCTGILCAVPSEGRSTDVALGQYLAGECVTCHRRDGPEKGIPPIIGWPSDQFVAVLQSYRLKDRPNQIMQAIASRMTDQEMAALAAFFEREKP